MRRKPWRTGKSVQYQGVGGGSIGIRTLETVPRLHTFQACAFDHSATDPLARFLHAGLDRMQGADGRKLRGWPGRMSDWPGRQNRLGQSCNRAVERLWRPVGSGCRPGQDRDEIGRLIRLDHWPGRAAVQAGLQCRLACRVGLSADQAGSQFRLGCRAGLSTVQAGSQFGLARSSGRAIAQVRFGEPSALTPVAPPPQQPARPRFIRPTPVHPPDPGSPARRQFKSCPNSPSPTPVQSSRAYSGGPCSRPYPSAPGRFRPSVPHGCRRRVAGRSDPPLRRSGSA